MRVLDIPQTQWASFFHMLNDRAAGRPARIEVIARNFGDQEASRHLPLRAIDFEPEAAEGGDVVIALGDDHAQLTCLVERPMRMAVGLSDGADPEWLCLLEADGRATMVYFEHRIAIEAEYFPN